MLDTLKQTLITKFTKLDEDALFYSLVMLGALFCSHFVMVAFIASQDLSGKWDKYRLKKTPNTIHTYLKHLPSVLSDWFFVLGPCLYVYAIFYKDSLFQSVISPELSFFHNLKAILFWVCLAVINNVVNRSFAMGAHYVLHIPPLYKLFHKQHHCLIVDLCSTSAWRDSFTEFFVMEVWGVFLFSQIFNPIPYQFQLIVCIYNGIFAAIDHSAFYVPNTWIDARYHFTHHIKINNNYAEMEILDQICGTIVHFEDMKSEKG